MFLPESTMHFLFATCLPSHPYDHMVFVKRKTQHSYCVLLSLVRITS